jgi:Flp pilus assembly protein CpaB
MKRILIFSVIAAWVAICGLLWTQLTEKKGAGPSLPNTGIQNVTVQEEMVN